jgi:hypothetical protein
LSLPAEYGAPCHLSIQIITRLFAVTVQVWPYSASSPEYRAPYSKSPGYGSRYPPPGLLGSHGIINDILFYQEEDCRLFYILVFAMR